RILVLLAAAALLGGAGLVVDQRRHAGRLAQLALHGVELVAMADGDARRPIGRRRIFLRLVGHHDDRPNALGRDLPRDYRRIERKYGCRTVITRGRASAFSLKSRNASRSPNWLPNWAVMPSL